MTSPPTPDDGSWRLTREDHGDGSGQFVLSRGGARVGSLDYRSGETGPIYIDFVEVAPALRRTGLGRQLVVAAVEWARASRRSIVALCSYSRSVILHDAALRDVLQ